MVHENLFQNSQCRLGFFLNWLKPQEKLYLVDERWFSSDVSLHATGCPYEALLPTAQDLICQALPG